MPSAGAAVPGYPRASRRDLPGPAVSPAPGCGGSARASRRQPPLAPQLLAGIREMGEAGARGGAGALRGERAAAPVDRRPGGGRGHPGPAGIPVSPPPAPPLTWSK